MFIIQFETTLGETRYVAEITNEYIDGSRSVNLAKRFGTKQCADEYCKRIDVKANFKIIKI